MHLPWVTAGDRCMGCLHPGLACWLLLMFLWLLTNNKLLKMVLTGFRDRSRRSQLHPVALDMLLNQLAIKAQCLKQLHEHLWHSSLVTSLKLLMHLPGPPRQWEWSKLWNICLNALFVLAVSLCHTSTCWEQKARPHVVSATVAPWQQAEQCQAKSLHRSYHQDWRGL